MTRHIQSDCDPEREEAFAALGFHLIGEDPDAPTRPPEDAEPIAQAVGQVRQSGATLYIYRALKPTKCMQCGREIAAGELLNSIFTLPCAHKVSVCESCRPTGKPGITPHTRGERAERDDHKLQSGPGTEREIPGVRRHGSNGWELAARLKKAHVLAGVFSRYGVTVEQVTGLGPDQWVLAARAARVNMPSVETQRVVIEILKSEEKLCKRP